MLPPKPKRIEYRHPNDKTTTYVAQLEHFQALIFEHFLGSLVETQERDLAARDSDDKLWIELQKGFNQWPIAELMKFGVMALYHRWERDVKEVFRDHEVPVPKPKGSEGVAKAFLCALEADLSAPTDPKCVTIIEECRRITNAIKHDAGSDYDKLEKDFPDYFIAGPEPAEDRFLIKGPQLVRFIEGFAAFWRNIPHYVDYRR